MEVWIVLLVLAVVGYALFSLAMKLPLLTIVLLLLGIDCGFDE